MFHFKFTYVVVTAVGFKKAVIIKQEEKKGIKTLKRAKAQKEKITMVPKPFLIGVRVRYVND